MGVPRTRAAGSGHAARSGSSAGPEAAAPHAGCAARRAAVGGPGEDRHLTRVGRQYAPGSAGQGLGPQGRNTCPACLAASVGFGVKPQGFRVAQVAPNNLIQGNKVPHPDTTRLSGVFYART